MTTGANGLNRADIQKTLKANWINGQPKADQKAAAKSLIRLSLTPANAAQLAAATGLDQTTLEAVAVKVRNGTALAPEDVSVIGRFDAIISALLDEAYERGDQQYRNWSKLAAARVAIVIAVLGGRILSGDLWGDYLPTWHCGTAILVGAISTPLAPIAKDLSSAIQTAVKAVASLKR